MSGREERTVLFQLPSLVSGQLICTQGTLAGRSWSLSAGTFVIGRQPGCDLTLATEPGVSKLHAKILAEGDHYALLDNESRNGTIVNGRPIQKARLKSGDEIRICNCVLRFTQTGEGLPTSMEGPPTSGEDEPSFDVSGGTSPEVSAHEAAEMTDPGAAPSSMSIAPMPVSSPMIEVPEPQVAAPHQATAMLPGPGRESSAAPTVEYSASSVEAPYLPPEERVASAIPWFTAGLVLMVVAGAGAWASLRFFGEELLGPMPTALAAADDASADPIAREKAAEARRAARDDEGLADTAPVAEAVGDDDARANAEAVDDAVGDEDEGTEVPKVPAAEAVAAADEPAAPVVAARKPPKPKKPSPVVAEEPVADEAEKPVKAVSASAGPTKWYAVVVEREGPVAVKTRAGGTVASVAASDGGAVKKGELLFSFEDAGSDEITNLRANIEALEAVAESQPSAQEMLDREREKLKRLLAKRGDVNVTAPASGKLQGFAVKVGDKLSAGAAVASVERGGEKLVVTTSAGDGKRLKRGGSVELKTRSGNASGRVVSVKRRGASAQVIIETDAASDDVSEARFP